MIPLPFARSEYDARLKAVRSAMACQELDALLVFHQENMYYLIGYDQIGYWVYQVLVVPIEGPLVAIVRQTNEMVVRRSPLVADVRAWRDDDRITPTKLTANVLDEMQLLDGKRIGIEMKSHALLPYYYSALRQELSAGTVIDASDIIAEIRLIKSPLEIDYMRKAAEIMDHAVEKGFTELKVGIRECDIHAIVAQAMYSSGGGPPAVAPPIASGPNLITQTLGAATERVIEVGDAFLLEVGAQYHRYHAVCMRMASLGTPPRRMVAMHDAIDEAVTGGIERMQPDMPVADLARQVHERLEIRGFSRPRMQVGYGIGIGYPPTWLEQYVSRLIAAGKPAKYIAEQAGHASVGFTLDTYGHLFETIKPIPVEWPEDLLWPAGLEGDVATLLEGSVQPSASR